MGHKLPCIIQRLKDGFSANFMLKLLLWKLRKPCLPMAHSGGLLIFLEISFPFLFSPYELKTFMYEPIRGRARVNLAFKFTSHYGSLKLKNVTYRKVNKIIILDGTTRKVFSTYLAEGCDRHGRWNSGKIQSPANKLCPYHIVK